jgi:hypothetical protein
MTRESLFLAALPVFLWSGYGHDGHHTALSTVGAQALNGIHWSAPVDMNPQTASGELLIHYGSPAVTAANTVLVPVKTGLTGGFAVQARSGATGALIYSLPSDYTLPPHDWTPPYGIVLSSPSNSGLLGREARPREPGGGARGPGAREPKLTERLYYPGAGGTVYYRDAVDSATGPSGQIAFYGNALYTANAAAFNSAVEISTPLTADSRGNIFFGFVVQGTNPANLTGGIARISSDGSGTWMSAQTLAGGDTLIVQGASNCAPALSRDESTIYFAVSGSGDFTNGYLAALDSTSLAPAARVRLMDPRGGLATVSGDSSASPMVGPDGDVYYGVLENNCCGSHNDRGWMLHFDSTLTQTKIPGSFGWDDTPSVVPANLVPSYTGASSYLILVKYNNYAGVGTGDGVNKLAVLDPNASQADEYAGSLPVAQVMQEVLTVTGPTPEPQPGFPNAVREWCINTAVIDPVSKSAFVNSEDGVMYRWDFTTNTLADKRRLTAGLGEAYTPTLIGADGTIYAINDATLFAIGN